MTHHYRAHAFWLTLSLFVLAGMLKPNSSFAQCNCNFTIPAGTGTVQFDGVARGLKPGDVICLAAGVRERITFSNIVGTATNPVIIRNCGGKAEIGGPLANSAITFTRSKFFRVTGTGDPAIEFGIKIIETKAGTQGILAADLSSDIEVDHVEITKTGFAGIMLKSDPSKDCANKIYERPNFTMNNIHIHDCYIHNIGGEGIYCGNSFYLGTTNYCGSLQYPHEIRGVNIHHNVFENNGWESIQVGAGVQNVEIHDNKIFNYGVANVNTQNGAIQVGNGSTGKVYNNYINKGTGIAILIQGIGDHTVYNNVIVNSGTFAILMAVRRTPLATDIVPNGFLGPVRIINNTIINPTAGVVRESLVGPPGNVIYNNLVVGGKSAWLELRNDTDWKRGNNLYLASVADAKFVNPTLNDYRLATGSPAINAGFNVSTFGVTNDFDGKARPSGAAYDVGAFELSGNVKPVVSVGANQTLTTPTSTTTLTGSATDIDGTIASYLWTKVSGPAVTLANESTTTLTVSGLVPGVYVFRLTATDNGGETGFADVTVTVVDAAANQNPVANAGTDQTITLPQNTATLNGSASDADGTVSSYQWSQVSGPATTLTNANQAVLSLSNLLQGVYVFKLTVTDDDNATGSDDVVVTVNAAATNQIPVVNAGVDQVITLPTNALSLPGSANDPDGTIQSYLWTKTSGGAATLANTTTASLGLTNLAQGVYIFRLTATDNAGATGFDEVRVTVNAANQAPIANAGPDKTVTLPTSTTTITGSGSDADGTIASYSWAKLSGPAATLTNPSLPTVTVSGLVAGTYVFQLTVTDDDGATDTDEVSIVVQNANVAPSANAGADVTIQLPVNTTTLNGTGTDSDGTIASYLWEKVSGGAVTLGAVNTNSLSLTNLVQGSYTFRLTVTDNGGLSASDLVTVNVLPALVNQVPVVNAGADRVITLPANSASVTAVASDPDGTIASYLWTKVSGPTATLAGTNTATLTASAMTAGDYIFRITVTDDKNASASDDIRIRVSAANQAPIVNAGPDQIIVLPTDLTTLTATASDPDGTISAYAWSQISGPAATLTGNATATLLVTNMVAGTYIFQINVLDDQSVTAFDQVKVIVETPANQTPVANAGSNRTIILPTNTVVLNGQGSDADGTIASYLWVQLSGGASTLSNTTTPSLTATSLVAGNYTFRLTVTDDDGATDFDDVLVQVLPATTNQLPIVSAGADLTLTLPANSANIIGLASDADGSITSYTWVKLSGPSASLINSNTPVLTVLDAVEGLYVFRLTVQDDKGATASADVRLTILPASVNQNPTVSAGNDVTLTLPANTASLKATASDNDGNITTFAWTKRSGPAATLAGETTANLSLSGLVEGSYIFRITVTDNAGGSSFDEVTVTVLPTGSNQPPLVNAGSDRNVFLPTNQLNLTGNVSDADGTISSLSWTKTKGPACILTNATTATLTVSGLVEGQYVFRLTATDNGGATSSDEVIVVVFPGSVNQPPVANAGANQTIALPQSSVTLTGSGSDADGVIQSFAWTQIFGPSLTLTDVNNPTLAVNNLTAGVYRFQLTVQDDDAATSSDVVEVTVVPEGTNLPPTADAGPDRTIFLPQNSIQLTGQGVDADGTIASYEWKKLAGPAATLAGATTNILTASALVEGVYRFSLTVRDNGNTINTDEVIVTVLPATSNTTPQVNAGADLQLRLPSNATTLTATASDPNGTIAAYAWTKKSGPATGTLTGVAQAQLSLSGLVEGIYVLSITVTDNDGATASDEVAVTVLPAGINRPPLVSAGPDQVLISPAATASLNGNAIDQEGFIKSLQWVQVAGPTTAVLTGDNTSVLSVADLELGTYQFEFRATDNENLLASDRVNVVVQGANQLPFAFAGNDTTLFLPNNFIIIEGIGTDADGFVTSFEWSQVAGTPAVLNVDENPIVGITELAEGNYTFRFTVRDDKGGTISDEVNISVMEDPVNPIGAAKFFSPNGDTVNDTFTIRNITMINNCPIRIFNRMGQQVFQSSNYENNWDGTVNGTAVQTGDYYFVVSCGSSKKYTGAFRLIR